MKGAETNYSAIEREALAIKFTLERHRYILIGHPIVIQSDHQPLKYLFKHSDLGARQSRWLTSLMEFDIRDINYIKGKSNVIADALSRSIDPVDSVQVLTRSMLTRTQTTARIRDRSATIDKAQETARVRDLSATIDKTLATARVRDCRATLDKAQETARVRDLSVTIDKTLATARVRDRSVRIDKDPRDQ